MNAESQHKAQSMFSMILNLEKIKNLTKFKFLHTRFFFTTKVTHFN